MSYETSTDRGVLLSSREWKAIGGASALMGLNVLVMYAFAVTPLAAVNGYLFAYPIVGVLAYGAAIAGGELIAERGVDRGDAGVALIGVLLLQVAFGVFGAGVLRFTAPGTRAEVLAITAVVVAVLTAAIGTYVYARSGSFDHYSRWANYAFLGGIAVIAVGTFVFRWLLLVGFVLVFAGFLFRLGWEMWRIREERVAAVSLQAIGLYIAVAGVFVHVLQIVARVVADR